MSEDCAALFVGETSRIEWKQSSKDTNELLTAVCALASDLGSSGLPGYVLVGLDPQGRAVASYAADEADKEQRVISDKLNTTKLQPHPSVDVWPCPHGDGTVFVIRVTPYAVPPVVKVDGSAWIRVGTTTRRAKDADLRRLEERRPLHLQPFDRRPIVGASLSDLSLSALQQQFELERESDEDPTSFPTLEKWLARRDLVMFDRSGVAAIPTACGLLVYGISPQDYFPGAVVDLARYQGTDFDAPVAFRKVVTGPLPDQLDALWKLLTSLVPDLPAAEHGMQMTFAPQYPADALKELVRNMIQHRDYAQARASSRISWFDDRIQFTNPGGPYGLASGAEFGELSDYRNPSLTAELTRLGYVQQLGRGVRRTKALLARNGNPALIVETDGYTTLTVKARTP